MPVSKNKKTKYRFFGGKRKKLLLLAKKRVQKRAYININAIKQKEKNKDVYTHTYARPHPNIKH